MNSLLRNFILFIAILFSGFNLLSQTLPPVNQVSDKQIQEIIEQIEARGLSDAEVELMAKARGYSDSDIAIIRERINRKKSGLDVRSVKESNAISREQIGEVSERVKKEDKTDTLKVKKFFGSEIFNNDRITFEPNLRVPTPPDYILGADDELSIDISGYAVASYTLQISPEGTVKLENLAPIYVNGLTITAAKEKIEQRLSGRFEGLKNGSLKMNLTLTKVKTIKVTLVGEIASPGTYSISSLATVFNALYSSGGPTINGSFRNIQLLRNNKIISTIDIYDYLLKGAMVGNVSLQERDVIFVPIVSTNVEVSGEVRRPFRFELKPTDSIDDLIRFAGGFTEKAYSSLLKVVRSTDKEKEIISVSKDIFSSFLLKSGDNVEVGAILDRFSNKVKVTGAVFRPGDYALDNSLTVGKLIKNAEGLREDAFKSRALIRRLGANLDPIIVPVNIDSVLLGFDVALKREDVLIIKSITELREFRKVSISGSINIPGEYDYIENMSVNDLILVAGGLREGGSKQRIEIARRIEDPETSGKNVEILFVNIDSNINSISGNFTLRPFDIVEVRGLPNYEPQKIVKISGQVNYPGEYTISKRTERISDLIDRAGGLRIEAYVKGGQFFRDSLQVAVDIEEVLKNKHKSYNLFLQEGDSLYIPKENQTVKVSGYVLNPTSVAYQENYSFKDYIIQSGGYTDSAFVKKVYVKYANGYVDKTKSFLTIKIYPKVEKGMEIHVPVKRRARMSKAEIISLSTGMISLSAVLITLFNVLR